MHVLLALNESEQSKYAFEWFCQNLLYTSTKITLLTVIEPPVQASYYYAASGALYTASVIEEVYQKATEAATQCVRYYNAQLQPLLTQGGRTSPPIVEMIVGRGDVRDEIVDLSHAASHDMQQGVDLVIVGAREMGGLKRAFVGSTSDYVVHHCHCPVLVVKQRLTKEVTKK